MSLDELLHEKSLEECLAYTECLTNVTYCFAQWFINLQGWRLVEVSTENVINPVKDKMSSCKYDLKFQYPNNFSFFRNFCTAKICIALV